MNIRPLEHYLLRKAAGKAWQKIGPFKRAGVLVPLFSLYSRQSQGIGDLYDLKLLVDWCEKAGVSIIQLLPMNEVGHTFCPYDSISSFAFDPMYLSLPAVGKSLGSTIKDITRLSNSFDLRARYVDYRIKDEKLKILQDIFRQGRYDEGALRRYKQENSYWVSDFALYKVLKSYQGQKPWYEWEAPYRDRDAASLESFTRAHIQEIDFQVWLQWQAASQFKEIKAYARSRGVFLKGDLPLLVSRDSADVWVRPDFFKLEYAAGAPPDMYCAKGQRWGMPSYNWAKIAEDGYVYVKEKLTYSENFYDILRIDHVAGLFRIWSIPYGEPLENKGLNGFFDPQEEANWEGHGRKLLLTMLMHTKMLLCAEDLGMVPRSCPKVLEELGIPGNDVQRWAKDWKVAHNFFKPNEYRVLSVAMLSAHDTTNWPAWWENEAGTADEDLFLRKCRQYGIDYSHVLPQLFDSHLSRHGRLRWLINVRGSEVFLSIIGKKKEEAADLLDIYENTFQEKEKLWAMTGLPGPMREQADSELLERIVQMNLDSASVFSIQLLTDLLYLAGLFKGDPYEYRINTPGTVSSKNWSLRMPIALEELLAHPVTDKVQTLVAHSKRGR
ncbi:MAG: 4-alpha-glucanotransferase [Candidatus Omnitrophota bacterium]|jgi:4-alpha-glucanotransferase|nr:MAG: 4-alpha-glucanotransferase [Candidatus Omnitrophota bacterium]